MLLAGCAADHDDPTASEEAAGEAEETTATSEQGIHTVQCTPTLKYSCNGSYYNRLYNCRTYGRRPVESFWTEWRATSRRCDTKP